MRKRSYLSVIREIQRQHREEKAQRQGLNLDYLRQLKAEREARIKELLDAQLPLPFTDPAVSDQPTLPLATSSVKRK